MKAILISIRPKHCCNILNLLKVLEIRKTMPKCKLPIDVYIYCTAEDKNGYLIRNRSTQKCEFTYNGFVKSVCWAGNRKVVAKFTLNKVEKICPRDYISLSGHRTETLSHNDLLEKSCLTSEELGKYLKGNGYAWHIDNLEIFDRPKELSEFIKTTCKGCPFENTQTCKNDIEGKLCRITKAPQNYCFIEV